MGIEFCVYDDVLSSSIMVDSSKITPSTENERKNTHIVKYATDLHFMHFKLIKYKYTHLYRRLSMHKGYYACGQHGASGCPCCRKGQSNANIAFFYDQFMLLLYMSISKKDFGIDYYLINPNLFINKINK